MKIIRHVTLGIASLPIAYLFAGWWQGSWWSERIWTWLNHLFGQNFGLASDAEFLLMLTCAFSFSFITISFLFWVVQNTYNSPRQNGTDQIKEVIYACLIGFLVLFTAYFLLWLSDFFGFRIPDGAAGVVFLVGISVSLIIVLSLMLLGRYLWRRIQSTLATGSTGHRR